MQPRITLRTLITLSVLCVPMPLVAETERWLFAIERLLAASPEEIDWRPFAPYATKPPPATSALEVIDAWWSAQDDDFFSKNKPPRPDAATEARLVEILAKDPDRLMVLVRHLSPTVANEALVRGVFPHGSETVSLRARHDVVHWLEVAHWELAPLEVLSEELLTFDPSSWLSDSLYLKRLERLVRRFGAEAMPLLERSSRWSNDALAACATLFLYDAMVASGADGVSAPRNRLQAIVREPECGDRLRTLALCRLCSSQWNGREIWFRDLLLDAAQRKWLSVCPSSFDEPPPLDQALAGDIGGLFEVLVALVGYPDSTVYDFAYVHDFAVERLAETSVEGHEAVIAERLLPWVRDATWSRAGSRLVFLERLGRIEFAPAIPAQLVAAEVESGAELLAVATALSHQGVDAAIRPLRQALADKRAGEFSAELFEAIYTLGGFSDAEVVAHIESKVRGGQQVLVPDPLLDGSPNLMYWAAMDEDFTSDLPTFAPEISPSLFAALAARVATLRANEPTFALRLAAFLAARVEPCASEYFFAQLAAGVIDASAIRVALTHRDVHSQQGGAALAAVLASEGFAAGVGAVMANDARAAEAILLGNNRAAQAALCACARIVRQELPLPLLRRALEAAPPALVRAAEAYLLTEASVAAQTILRKRYPDAYLVLRTHFHSPSVDSFVDAEWAQRFRAPSAPDEVLVLEEAGCFYGSTISFTRHGEEVWLRIPVDDDRSRSRKLTQDEWRTIQRVIESYDFFELPHISACESTFSRALIRCTPEGGRCINICAACPASAASPWTLVWRQIYPLAWTVGMPIVYERLEGMPGARVLYSDEKRPLHAVTVHNGEVRVGFGLDKNGTPTVSSNASMLDWHVWDGANVGERVLPPAEWAGFEPRVGHPAFVRAPQPTRQANEVWATLLAENHTTLGRAHRTRSGFTPVRSYPIQFNADNCFVDETAQLVYVVVHGDLLVLPLAPL
ncbi:MAG: hypothetical protein ACKVX7_03170 [Planctomycetota bacterium]